VLLRSDGLRNYATTPDELGRVFAETAGDAGPDPTRIAADLVTWANAQGGRDNITVALARLPAPVAAT
jgi:serine/threonine protein phosphatase PrpC